MASWLKAAEDLFEVVDRQAKLVVGEKPDEQPSLIPGSNGRGSQTKTARRRAKKKQSSNKDPSAIDIGREKIPGKFQPQADNDRDVLGLLIENNEHNPSTPSGKVDSNEQQKADRDDLLTETSLPGTMSNNEVKSTGDHLDAVSSSNAEAASSNLNGVTRNEEFADTSIENPSNGTRDAKIVVNNYSADSDQIMISDNANSIKSIGHLETQTSHEDAVVKDVTQLKDVDSVTESDIQNKQPQEQKTRTVAAKVQEQLEEAQGLLKTTTSSGQSKEARLARVCAGLSSRLQEYKSENAQLEELLVAERELAKSYEAKINQLQKDLSAARGEASRVEANMAEALLAKNAEIESLVGSIDSLKKQAALSDESLASLQENMESMMRNRELTETRMMQALREELSSAERRAEEEHAAYNATKLAAREREVELEQRAIEASAALARIQRTADDRASKAAELEQKVALLEVECASLNQELQDMEARVRREQKRTPDDANQTIQLQAWQEEVERARRAQREAAESKLSSMESEVQKMRVEMASMKRDAEHYSRQEHMELEKRYRELTDLLYYKQTQLETMASEKAAAEFQLEKEVKHLQEAQLEAERNRASRRTSTSWEEDTDMKTLEPLPLHHRHMAGASFQLQLQRAAKLLDTGVARVTKFLWRYPIARVVLVFYLVFVHLFLMYLLHRLQVQADAHTLKEVEESMRLFNKTLP